MTPATSLSREATSRSTSRCRRSARRGTCFGGSLAFPSGSTGTVTAARPTLRRMPILEIRRHAERADHGNEKSALSAAGRAMAEQLAKRTPKFALVLSSPLPRAKETAQLIAGRLDAIESGLLPEMGGVIGDRIFGEMRTLADWAEVLSEREDARQFAAEQLATWARIASRIGDKDRVLTVSHGGIIELPAITLAERLRARLDGPAFGYCEGVVITYAKGSPTKIEAV